MGGSLAGGVLAGHVASAARLIRLLEDERPAGREALRELYPKSGRAHVVGVTGPPGAGKSTLVSALISELRKAGRRVGVIAVDPSSSVSGGALLGDRVRMQRHATDDGVFIRSMASRGHPGGLARAAWEAGVVLDAMGFDLLLVETVGVGQGELDIMDLAQTTVVVCLPDAGDEVQAIKAGLLEIADLLVLNKADLPGAEQAERHLQAMLQHGPASSWPRPLLRTIAAREQGTPELMQALAAHRAHLEASGELALVERKRARRPFLERVRERVASGLEASLANGPEAQALLAEVERRALDPYTAADRWLARTGGLP